MAEAKALEAVSEELAPEGSPWRNRSMEELEDIFRQAARLYLPTLH